jgi:rod shape-determining protein MreD
VRKRRAAASRFGAEPSASAFRLNKAMASLMPVATTLLAMALSVEPLRIPGFGEATPAFALIAAYHWTIYRPGLLPASALFAVGTLQDLLSGSVPGVTAFLLLLFRAILLNRRHLFVDRPFSFIWAGFALLTGGAMLILWTIHSLFAGELLGFHSPGACAVLTISLFPVASFLLGRCQRSLMGGAPPAPPEQAT